MAERHQLLRQPMHHPLGAAIKLGWNSLRQRSNLRDAHLTFSCLRSWMKSPSRRHRHAANEGTSLHLRSSLAQRLLLRNEVRDVAMVMRAARKLRDGVTLQDLLVRNAATRELHARIHRSQGGTPSAGNWHQKRQV